MPVLSPGTLFDHPNRVGSEDEEAPNPKLRGEKEEKQEIGPVDSLEVKDEEEDDTSNVKTPSVDDGGGRTGVEYPDRSGDRSANRSPRSQRVERTKSSRSSVSRNVEETREEISRCRQVDFTGQLTGPDRSGDRSGTGRVTGHRSFRAIMMKKTEKTNAVEIRSMIN